MRRKKGFWALGVALLVFCPLGFGASGQEKYVTYLSLADYTGPIAGLNVPADSGLEDFFKDLNDRGGVDGVKIKFLGVDTRYDVARGVSAYKRYRTEHKLVLVNAISTGIGKAIAPLTDRDKIPQLVPGDGEFQAKPGRVFTWGTCYQDAFAATIDWILEDWKAKGRSALPKIGYISWDNPYGREPLRGGKEYAEKVGVTLLPPEFFPPGTLDHSVWLTRLANAGADYIIIGGVDPTPTNILRDAHKMGLTAKIQFVDATFWGPDETVGIKAHPEATEGAVICVYYLRGKEAREHPLAKRIWQKYRGRPIEEMGSTYATGMIWGLDLEAALKIALKEVGYEKLDGEAVFKAYMKLGGGDHRQGLAGNCTYGPQSRRGSDMVKFYRVQGGKLVPITGWRKAPDAVSLHKF